MLFKKLGNHQAEAGELLVRNPQRSEISHQNYLEQKSCFFPLNLAAKALENCCLGDDPFLLERQALRGYVSFRGGGIFFISMTKKNSYHSSKSDVVSLKMDH